MNKKLGLILFFTLFIGFVGFVTSGFVKVWAYNVPTYDGFVNDFASVLSLETEQELESKLTTLASEENGAEISVVTISSMEGDYIEAVAQDFFDEWAIGKKNADNGVLLILAVKEREVRIQTGYGAEVFLTDAMSGRIIRDVMAPALKKKDYDKAVSLGVGEIISASKRIDQSELVNNSSSGNSAFINTLNAGTSLLIFFSIMGTYLASFLGRSKSWWAGGMIGLLSGALIVGMKYSFVVALVGLLFDYLLSKNYKKWQLEHKTTAWRKTLGGFRSGSSSSGSGMSFGGGRSGGGGASGKW